MIVKVQVSLATMHDKQQMLIYNQDRCICFEGDADSKTLRLMRGAKKAYFNSTLVGTTINLCTKAPEQDW